MIGHQKGRDLKERTRRNFGMAYPEGYRKAMRIMELAERHSFPVVTLIDTPGAYPGAAAEQHGQGGAIARSQALMARLTVPIVSCVIGEGGSGGAIAIALADRVLMQENAIYSVISPEGCAAILWGDAAKAPDAAELMRVTATELLRLGVIDAIVPEPPGGAHRDWDETATNIREALRSHLEALRPKSPEELLAELDVPTRDSKVCQGTLLSRAQYLVDIDEWGYADARQKPRGPMSPSDIQHWTAAIEEKK